jgi:hypothetical protein
MRGDAGVHFTQVVGRWCRAREVAVRLGLIGSGRSVIIIKEWAFQLELLINRDSKV